MSSLSKSTWQRATRDREPRGRNGRARRHGTGTGSSRGEPGADSRPPTGARHPNPDPPERADVGQQARTWRAVRRQISRVMLECSRWKTTSAEATLRLRAIDLLRGAQNGQRVRMRSPVGAPDDWGVRDVLAKKRVQVGPIVQKFGLDLRLSAVSSSLRRVRGTDGDIQGSVGVAQGRGEDVCGPQVRARD